MENVAENARRVVDRDRRFRDSLLDIKSRLDWALAVLVVMTLVFVVLVRHIRYARRLRACHARQG